VHAALDRLEKRRVGHRPDHALERKTLVGCLDRAGYVDCRDQIGVRSCLRRDWANQEGE
jgi:hypothetical protein